MNSRSSFFEKKPRNLEMKPRGSFFKKLTLKMNPRDAFFGEKNKKEPLGRV